ncbi:MAG: hypothetical protein RID22_23745 [Roseibium aggregatum]
MTRILLYNGELDFLTRGYMAAHSGYSYSSTDEILGYLVQNAPSGGFGVVELVFHSGVPGQVTLLDADCVGGFTAASPVGMVSHSSGMENFWRTLGQYIRPGGVLSLNACSIAEGRAGGHLLRHLCRTIGGGKRVCGGLGDQTSGVFEYNNASLMRGYPYYF